MRELGDSNVSEAELLKPALSVSRTLYPDPPKLHFPVFRSFLWLLVKNTCTCTCGPCLRCLLKPSQFPEQ